MLFKKRSETTVNDAAFNGSPSAIGRFFRRRWIKPVAVALIALLAIGSLATWRAMANKKPDPKKTQESVFEFSKGDLALLSPRELGNMIPVSGTLKPLTQAVVKSKVAAEVAQVHVQEGQRVTAGQVLVSLDTADLRARLDAQHASVAEMKARLELASKNEANNKQLLAKNFISQNALDAVSSNAEVARANLRSAEAQAAISQRALNDASIRAPFAGIVAKRMINIGEKVSADMAVMQIVDLTRMELESMIPVSEIPHVRIGQEIAFTVEGFTGRQFTGKVERINPSADAGSRSIAVFVAIANADQSLKGGMFASGKLAAQSRGPVNALPLVALREEGGQSFVFTIEKEKLVRKPVSVGARNIDMGLVEIRDGLADGTQVVSVKMEGLKAGGKAIIQLDGTKVTATEPSTIGKPAAAGKL